MITDHGKANHDLRPIAETAHVKVTDQLKGEAKSTYNKLEKLSGPDFDRVYISDSEGSPERRGRVSKGTGPGERFAAQGLRK